jgi:hypothetical protein
MIPEDLEKVSTDERRHEGSAGKQNRGWGAGERQPRDERNFGTQLMEQPGTGGRERAEETLN